MYKYLKNFIKKSKINMEYNNYSNNELYMIDKIIKKDIIIDTNNSNILNFIGIYYEFKNNNIKKAKEYYLKAIKLNNSDAMNNYANLLEQENKIEESKKYYLKAVKLNNVEAMYNYSILLGYENKIEEANKYYLNALELKK